MPEVVAWNWVVAGDRMWSNTVNEFNMWVMQMCLIQWFNKLSQFGYSTAVFCDCSIPVYIYSNKFTDEAVQPAVIPK